MKPLEEIMNTFVEEPTEKLCGIIVIYMMYK